MGGCCRGRERARKSAEGGQGGQGRGSGEWELGPTRRTRLGPALVAHERHRLFPFSGIFACLFRDEPQGFGET